MIDYEESIIGRLRVLFGHYYCPDCYYYHNCTDKCGRRHQKELSKISESIGKERFNDARKLISILALKIGEDEPELTRLRTLMCFLEGDD